MWMLVTSETYVLKFSNPNGLQDTGIARSEIWGRDLVEKEPKSR